MVCSLKINRVRGGHRLTGLWRVRRKRMQAIICRRSLDETNQAFLYILIYVNIYDYT
jgi:hypothetical protein